MGYGLAGEPVRRDEGTAASWEDYVGFLADYPAARVQQLSGLPAERIRWLASLYGDRTRKVTSVWGAGATQHARGT